jgi:O-methyltransferase
MQGVRDLIGRLVARRGYAILNRRVAQPDMDGEFTGLYERCRPFTMTPVERMYALYAGTKYVVARDVPGDVVECGVWKGGSAMLAALTLDRVNGRDRRLHLFDTFAGMTEPTAPDGRAALEEWRRRDRGDHNEWCYSGREEVEANMRSTGYPAERVTLVEGKVEDTLPERAPDRIALLRLDTDWYQSTYHELVHLYPRLEPGGVLIIDDYGHWSGARRAVDRYLAEIETPVLLNRIDNGGRIAIKP